jgi:hypothetical protein
VDTSAADPSADPNAELIARLQARVAQRRASGEYPPDLEWELDEHFRRITAYRSLPTPAELTDALATLVERSKFELRPIPVGSSVPGASRALGRVANAVEEQTRDLADQLRAFAESVRGALDAVISAMSAFPATVQAQIDAAQDVQALLDVRQHQVERTLELARRRHHTLTTIVGSVSGDAMVDELEHADLVARLLGFGPVLDLTASPVFSRMLAAEEIVLSPADGSIEERLGALHDGSLGAAVVVDAAASLSSRELPAVVVELARALRPGGFVLVETANPASWWGAATSTRPVTASWPAGWVTDLFTAAGFGDVKLEWRGQPPGELTDAADDDVAGGAGVGVGGGPLASLLLAPARYLVTARR